MSKNDLSHVYASNPDEGQDHHGNLPDDAVMHMAHMYAHKAGLRDDPGKYQGPDVEVPEEWSTPQLAFEMQESNRRNKIDSPAPPSAPMLKQASGEPPTRPI